MENYYIFITNDNENIDGSVISAMELTNYRLSNKKWPIYKNTKHKKIIKTDDKCLFYIAGRFDKRQSMVAFADISNNIKCVNGESTDPSNVLAEPAERIIELSNIKKLPQIEIKPLLHEISFVKKNLFSWGVYFMGGCRKIDKNDYLLITNKMKKY